MSFQPFIFGTLFIICSVIFLLPGVQQGIVGAYFFFTLITLGTGLVIISLVDFYKGSHNRV
jgi:hypothetical protein